MDQFSMREMRMERDAELYRRRFPEQMNALESHSPLRKVRPISAYDVFVLGEQLAQFQMYEQFLQEAGSGTSSDLGKLPDIALDVIAASYGASIVPIICSVQPIEEERGIVYFKKTEALTTRGNVTANQITLDPTAPPQVYPQGYAGEMVAGIALGNTAGGTTAYTGSFNTKVRPGTVRLDVATTPACYAVDDREGNLLGIGCSGTIVYSTGVWTLTLAADPAGVVAMTGRYGSDYEAGAAIPQIQTRLVSTDITAEVFALSQELGLLKSFSLRKRFGKVAEDEQMADLTNSVTGEIGNSAIAKLIATYTTSVNWCKVPVAGVSWAEHKEELKDVIARTGSTIYTNAGRGECNIVIAGPEAAGIISTLPGFVPSNINIQGPHVFGTLDGRIVIQAPQITTNHIYCVYKGTGAFDAPIVYSPYMPLFVTGSLPVSGNYMKTAGLVAVWAGLKVVMSKFVTRIVITSA